MTRKGLSRRKLLQRTGTVAAVLATPSVAHADTSQEYTFESHLPVDFRGPYVAHYQWYSPEDTSLDVYYHLVVDQKPETPYGGIILFHHPYPGYHIKNSGRAKESYVCGPAIGNCKGTEVERQHWDTGGSSRSFGMSVEAGTSMEWTFVSPHWTSFAEYGGFEEPLKVEFTADKPFTAAMEAGTTLHAFDQHSFEDGAEVVTNTGKDTPLPDDRSGDAELMADQHFTASVPDPNARLGLAAQSFYFPAGASFGTARLRAGHFAAHHPGGTERWLLSDNRDVISLLGDSGPYRLDLTRALVHSRRTFAGFLAGLEEVDDIRDAID